MNAATALRPPRSLLKKTVVFAAVLLVAGAVWALRPAAPLPVRAVTPEHGPIESTLRATGRVINDRVVMLTALADGQVQQMLVQKGARVRAGQVLARLDGREARAWLDKARALVAQEEVEVERTARTLHRLRGLQPSGNASAQAVEDAESAWQAAQARLRTAQAEARIAELNVEKTGVTAPFAGVVTEKSVEAGQWVEAATKLFTVAAEAGREIETQIDAGNTGSVEIGQTARITCEAFPGKIWTERVSWIAPAVSTEKEAANTFAVRLTLGREAPPLLLDQQVDVELRAGYREQALKLPYAAVIEEDGKSLVAVIRDGEVRRAPVTTGLGDLTHIEITGGLAGGERVILPDGKIPPDGTPVRADGT